MVADPRASYGKAGVLHIVATAEEPLTASDIGDMIDKDPLNVSQMLTTLYRDGFVWRREINQGWGGGKTFEYTLAPREEQTDA